MLVTSGTLYERSVMPRDVEQLHIGKTIDQARDNNFSAKQQYVFPPDSWRSVQGLSRKLAS